MQREGLADRRGVTAVRSGRTLACHWLLRQRVGPGKRLHPGLEATSVLPVANQDAPLLFLLTSSHPDESCRLARETPVVKRGRNVVVL